MRWRTRQSAGGPPTSAGPALQRASRHSQLVDLLRFALPAAALILIGVVVLWPRIIGGYGSLIMPMLRSEQVADVDAMRMQKPRYVGQTRNAEPYAVTADSAIMDPARPNRLHLERLAADIARAGQRHIHLLALAGIYHRRTERLDLDGGIELTTSDGYQFATQSAQVDLDQGRVVGRTPITGSGPAGTLSADRFEIRDGGDILHFQGRVRVVLQPRSGGGESS